MEPPARSLNMHDAATEKMFTSRDANMTLPQDTVPFRMFGMTLAAQSATSNEELEDLILSCRYGDLEDVRDFVGRRGVAALDDYLDEYGNSCLHMAAANGHEGQNFCSFLI